MRARRSVRFLLVGLSALLLGAFGFVRTRIAGFPDWVAIVVGAFGAGVAMWIISQALKETDGEVEASKGLLEEAAAREKNAIVEGDGANGR